MAELVSTIYYLVPTGDIEAAWFSDPLVSQKSQVNCTTNLAGTTTVLKCEGVTPAFLSSYPSKVNSEMLILLSTDIEWLDTRPIAGGA